MDLRSKLGLYREGVVKPPSPLKKHSSLDIDSLVPGSVCTNDYGNCYIIEKRYGLSHLHGGSRLGAALEIDSEKLAALGGIECASLQPDRLLFLDTETTGLSGGAGTLAFLVGIGFFEKDAFVLRQYFLRDYNEEASMLAELKQLFNYFSGFVTFNGKSFDINLLQSRFISNRYRPSFSTMPNLDLLYPARKVWGLKLESCRLSSLEENILGEFREDDIPGAQIPSVYFKYLEDRDAGEIKRVISHNELDILSMVSLLTRLSIMVQSPLLETDGGFELLGMGKIFAANGKTDDMLQCLEACVDSIHYTVRMQAVKRLTGVYKRSGRVELALELWKAVERENPGFELFHLIEMAKYYEHKAKETDLALKVVEKAIQNCLHTGLKNGRQLEALKKRRDRLRKKAPSPQYPHADSP